MLSVYAWALLIIAIFVAFIFVISGPKAPISYLPPVCNIEPLLPCVQSTLTSVNTAHSIPIKYTVVFLDSLGVGMHLPANAISVTLTNIGSTGTNVYNGTCLPRNVSSGTRVICAVSIPGSVEPPLGSTTTATFDLHYYTCKSGVCTGPYVTAGASTQSMSPAYVPFYNVTLYTSPTSGEK
ncbi:MAG: hypothetical protein JJ59_05090 [Candidatus Micrarchaeum sp. AZ1]|nr:MAG: hypothetical protein JJ59_05090 [Candidatus Micrarchaeum sp. AZ1]